ncbi:putative ABC transporter ATP-binding protein YbhF [Roseimaritima multifibrata]|uniref:Putative ABC transporter ATP-binding protein YbhF n=1 Tax=Roseimaritima multifibrata TaxID=1930274 RepID=A0A517MME1_9BACT|nr:ribosome-associated ATPase/putative transporter RbbA [Roseimaritima multifibrata]QDS96052.1 putative ABC transporter ATP-binding protein YbhF [Roseimaritima multifibrata]
MNHVIRIESLSHRYGRKIALDDIHLELPAGEMIGLIGPDGVGKSTLMGLVAGAKKIQTGHVETLGQDMRLGKNRDAVCPRIAYMPQGLGKNLYAELTVMQNLDFFGRLFALPARQRRARIDRLLEATGLDPFPNRQAGQLSGGMKQKLGLCCALLHEPDLLILDEPTTGVDPLSRQQFWKLIDDLRGESDSMSVLVSTAYMEEADQYDSLVAMHGGKVLAFGTPLELRQQTHTDSLEAAFVQLLPEDVRGDAQPLVIPERPSGGTEVAIEAEGLTRRFGDFVAVSDVSFRIEKGEIFGFLGSNGCGKTTTMKMLTGLLPASEGTAKLFGESVEAGSMEIRRRVGYMSQSFSLYGELTVDQNLWLHARLFDVPVRERTSRIAELVEEFGLEGRNKDLAASLPLGVRQRLSLAVAVLHRPEMLILDEPTSGVDPIARDNFWRLLVRLSRESGVTIFVSTHFMNEAMRCDRISLMNAGKVLASGAPKSLVESKGAATLEEAFIDYMQAAEQDDNRGEETERIDSKNEGQVHPAAPGEKLAGLPLASGATKADRQFFRVRRMLAYSYRETLEILRDPVRLAFAFGGSVLLMFVFGFGITSDVNRVEFAVLDQDRSPESLDYASALIGSSYFDQQAEILDLDDMQRKLENNEITVAIEIPPQFGRELKRGSMPQVSAWIDGANPSRASTIEGYMQGVHAGVLQDLAIENGNASSVPAVSIEQRFRYNPTFESINAMVPSVPAILLVLIPAILMAASVVKEKELGSITNFYVTPTSRLEFLLGKQLPYIAIGMTNFVLLTLLAIFLFNVPLKGSGLMLAFCALAYVTATTGIGLLVSSFTRSQVAAVFVTTVVTILPSISLSGLMQPVSTLEGGARWMGTFWPTTYYMHASVGAFTKGLTASQLMPDFLSLLAFIPVLTVLTAMALKKQET